MNIEDTRESFMPAPLKSAGFKRRWRASKTSFDPAIEKGVKDSLKAFEESRRTTPVIIGRFRLD
jgi:hypothetical protein